MGENFTQKKPEFLGKLKFSDNDDRKIKNLNPVNTFSLGFQPIGSSYRSSRDKSPDEGNTKLNISDIRKISQKLRFCSKEDLQRFDSE
jgi:hypothetical protein